MFQLNLFPQPIKNIFHLCQAFLACCFYKFLARKLTVVGVTGTDGKTTTSYFIHETKVTMRFWLAGAALAFIGLFIATFGRL